MMSTMTTSTSARARAGATPEFVALCKTLYGPAIDAVQIWDDVFKLSPDGADYKAHASTGAKIKRGAALVSTAAGAGLAVKEGVGAVKDFRALSGGTNALRAGKEITRASASRRAGIAALAGGGDVLATDELRPSKNLVATGQRVPVGKANFLGALPKLDDVVAGGRRVLGQVTNAIKPQGATPAVGTTAGKLEQANRAQTAGLRAAGKPTSQIQATNRVKSDATTAAVGNDVGAMLSTKSGKVLATGAVATPVVAGAQAHQRKKANAAYVDDYAKADVTFSGTFSKLDEDKHLAFGWASVTAIGGTPVVDRQGDYITTDDIEKAAYEFVHKSRVGGNMHARSGSSPQHVSDMVESMVFTDDKVAKMGLPDDFPRGWWVGFKIHDEPTWQMVKKGERTGFSIHGKGIRKDEVLDDVMGYR